MSQVKAPSMQHCTSRPGTHKPTNLPVSWKQVQGVLFDVDGTLAHSDDLHYKAFVEILLRENFNGGEPIDRDFFDENIAEAPTSWNPAMEMLIVSNRVVLRSTSPLLQRMSDLRVGRSLVKIRVGALVPSKGRHNPDIAADLFPDRSIESHQVFSEEKEAIFRDLAANELQAIPGLQDLLQIIDNQSLKKIAVTNAPPKNVGFMLEAIGLSTYFEEVVFGEHCPRAKPFPDPYLIGLEKLSLSADNALVFEDSPSGVAAGVAAGVTVIALATTQSPSVLLEAGASIVVQDFTEVVDLINAELS